MTSTSLLVGMSAPSPSHHRDPCETDSPGDPDRSSVFLDRKVDESPSKAHDRRREDRAAATARLVRRRNVTSTREY